MKSYWYNYKIEIIQKLSGVSQTNVQRTLTELVKKEKINKIGNVLLNILGIERMNGNNNIIKHRVNED